MDRLPAVVAAAVALTACADSTGAGKPAPARSRVDAVAATKVQDLDPTEFCEVNPTPQAAATLTWPALRDATPPTGSGKPRWINVWATWCHPCVEELPRIAAWRATIGKRVDYDVVFVSADGDAEAVTTFTATHPEVKDTLQLADAEQLQPWLAGLGITNAGGLPVHLFVDAQDRVRCARMSGIGDDDQEAVAQLLSGL